MKKLLSLLVLTGTLFAQANNIFTLNPSVNSAGMGNVGQGLHNYNFGSLPDAIDEEGVSLFNGYKDLDSGIYPFVLETEDRIKSKKFTIIK